MSEQQKPEVRPEEPQLSDEALEQVSGGCAIRSEDHDIRPTVMPFPRGDDFIEIAPLDVNQL